MLCYCGLAVYPQCLAVGDAAVLFFLCIHILFFLPVSLFEGSILRWRYERDDLRELWWCHYSSSYSSAFAFPQFPLCSLLRKLHSLAQLRTVQGIAECAGS